MAGLCTLIALLTIVACIYVAFCATDERERKTEFPKECRRLHRSVKGGELPHWDEVPEIPPIHIKV